MIRTIADPEGVETINEKHFAEASQYRLLDSGFSL
jgi:predicted ATPase with chaperone activity